MIWRRVLLAALVVCAVIVSGCATGPLTKHPDSGKWQAVLADDLSNCTFKPGSWTYEDSVLTRKGGGDIWTNERYGDFVLDLEFKLAEKTNSGVFIRTDDIVQWLHTGIEIQVYDSYGKEEPGKHDCGAVYDVKEPSVNAVKESGQWNRMSIKAEGSEISIVMNGKRIIDIDLNDWPEAHKNPDGTDNKFNIAYAEMARDGVFGFQDHGKPVWYRNIRVKKL